MTRTFPLRRMIRHCSHQVLTDGLTFMASLPLFVSGVGAVPIANPATGEIVRAELQLDSITGQNFDSVQAHFAGKGGKHGVLVLSGSYDNSKHGVRQRLGYRPVNFNGIF